MAKVARDDEPQGSKAMPVDSSSSTYPIALECDLVTSTGVKLHMRPIKPSDAPRLARFHEQLSESAIFRRYFAWHPVLSPEELEHLTNLDYVDRFAYVVQGDQDELVAVGRYERIEGTNDAEVAFVVIDHFQHHGIGILLLWHLARAARPKGITHFVAETQTDNRGMLGVFRDSGYPVSSTIESEIVSLRFPIQSTQESHAHFLRRTTLFEPDDSHEDGPA
jgi:GNAT superfamily N-acetyltransferase